MLDTGDPFVRLSPHAGSYRYTPDLLKLSAAVRPDETRHAPELLHIGSPLLPCIAAWLAGLADHPDSAFVGYVTEGIRRGFRVGFDYATQLQSAR